MSKQWPLVLALTALALYGVGLRGPYFQDDYLYFFDPPPTHPLFFFTHRHVTGFYRPIQATILLLIQHGVGLETLPIHLLQVALHVLLAALLYRAMKTYGFGETAARASSLFLTCSQAAACAVMGLDTQSQIEGALFGWAGLWAFDTALTATETSRRHKPPLAFSSLDWRFCQKKARSGLFCCSPSSPPVALRRTERESVALFSGC